MKVTRIIGADVCRDGGSYSFSYESNDKEWYELFIQVKGFETNEYYEPAIYRRGYNSGELIQQLSWDEAKAFLFNLKYENQRFQELVRIVENHGYIT